MTTFHNIGCKEYETFPDGYPDLMREFFSKKHEGINYIFDSVFDSILYPLQRKNELREMLTTALYNESRVVGEIGCDKGGSLFHWASLPGVKRVYGCEYRGVPFCHEMDAYFPDTDFLFVHGSSYSLDTKDTVEGWLDGDKFDCLFLDGDKSAFYKDYLMYKDMIRPGGFMFLHDINGEPPEADFNRISEIEKTYKFIDTSEAKDIPDDFQPRTNWEAWLKHWGERSCGVGVVCL